MRATCHILFLALAFVLVAPAAPVLAQPPVREVCDQTESGERIKCKFDNVLRQQRGVVEMIDQLQLVPPGQREAMTHEVDRAVRAHGRTSPMEFKQLTRKSEVTCEIKELLGDGQGDEDGLCTGGEDCEEVLGDQIGNDDGICRPRNGNNREVCVEICDFSAVNANPENFDDDPNADSRGRDLEETLDGLTDQYEGINLLMELEAESLGVSGASSLAAGPPASLATGACAVAHRQRTSSSVIAVLVGVREGLRLTADVSERFCDQAAFGFSGSSVCAVVEGLAGVANIVATAFEFGDDDITADTVDSVYACLQQTSEIAVTAAAAVSIVGTDLGAVNQLVAAVDQRVAFVDQKVVALDQNVHVLDEKVNGLTAQLEQARRTLAEIIILLQTPPGLRPEFPTPPPTQ